MTKKLFYPQSQANIKSVNPLVRDSVIMNYKHFHNRPELQKYRKSYQKVLGLLSYNSKHPSIGYLLKFTPVILLGSRCQKMKLKLNLLQNIFMRNLVPEHQGTKQTRNDQLGTKQTRN